MNARGRRARQAGWRARASTTASASIVIYINGSIISFVIARAAGAAGWVVGESVYHSKRFVPPAGNERQMY